MEEEFDVDADYFHFICLF